MAKNKKSKLTSKTKVNNPYTTNKISATLVSEIKEALGSINYGSLEIYVQEGVVTQMTIRSIKKTVNRNSNGQYVSKTG